MSEHIDRENVIEGFGRALMGLDDLMDAAADAGDQDLLDDVNAIYGEVQTMQKEYES